MVYKLLQVSHTLWITRNGILHERDQQGLLLAKGQTLREAITARYGRSKAALLPEDYHLLDRPLFRILEMSASDEYTWLGALKLGHKLKRREWRNPIVRMRQGMADWLDQDMNNRPQRRMTTIIMKWRRVFETRLAAITFCERLRELLTYGETATYYSHLSYATNQRLQQIIFFSSSGHLLSGF
jgi:hypothetical protein